jgi:hypothetical protein
MVRTFCWAAASWQSNRAGKIARKNKDFMRESSTSGSSRCLYHFFTCSVHRKILASRVSPDLEKALAVAVASGDRLKKLSAKEVSHEKTTYGRITHLPQISCHRC